MFTKIAAGLACLLVLTLVAFLVWFGFWVHFVDRHELGFLYNKFDGKISKLDRTGWVVTTPWKIDVHKIDLRPGQVCMNANSRVLNCKLVQFNPDGLGTFVDWHGREAGNGGNVYEILKSYAFNVNEGRDCPFLSIRDDMRRKNGIVAVPTEAKVEGAAPAVNR